MFLSKLQETLVELILKCWAKLGGNYVDVGKKIEIVHMGTLVLGLGV